MVTWTQAPYSLSVDRVKTADGFQNSGPFTVLQGQV